VIGATAVANADADVIEDLGGRNVGEGMSGIEIVGEVELEWSRVCVMDPPSGGKVMQVGRRGRTPYPPSSGVGVTCRQQPRLGCYCDKCDAVMRWGVQSDLDGGYEGRWAKDEGRSRVDVMIGLGGFVSE
jgi:hypothetical protein